MHPPHGGRGDTNAPSLQDAARGRPERGPLTSEITLPLSSADPAALQPLKRNLVISTAAGVSFLVTVILTALGLRSYVRGRKLEEQVELARQVQARLLPARDSAIASKRSAVIYEPAEEVGGDFYDLWPRKQSGLAAVIGDVSGKGLPAALLMGVIHGAVRTSKWQDSGSEQCASTSELNRLLCEGASQNRYASMFWCVVDEKAGELRYTNAGHCPPFLLRAGYDGPTCIRLTGGGTVLGLIPGATYASATEIVHPGDLLVMYSDGLTEATSKDGEEYGDGRVERLLVTHFASHIDQLTGSLVESWRQFSPDVGSHDDLTVVAIRL